MKVAWSRVTSTRTPGGSAARISARRATTASAMATVLVPDCLRTSSVKPLWPL